MTIYSFFQLNPINYNEEPKDTQRNRNHILYKLVIVDKQINPISVRLTKNESSEYNSSFCF